MTSSGSGALWVVAGGGTGGHVMPAIALAEALVARGDRVLVLGSERGLEQKLVAPAGFELVALPSRQVAGQGLVARARALLTLLATVPAAHAILRRRGADGVISIGGYAAVPAVLAAALARIPLALVEPNAVPGRANRLTARFARRIFTQFDEAAAALAAGRAQTVRTVGIPLRRALLEALPADLERRRPAPPFRLLVFGGSQGARQINEAMMEAISRLDFTALEVVHQTGAADRDRVAAAYAKAGVKAEVIAFEPDMPRRYRWADLALCRAGAITVAELLLARLPALLVPYPFAADDHQAANARVLAESGAARLLDSRDFCADRLVHALESLFAEPSALVDMSARAGRLARRDAARAIVEECAALVPPRSASPAADPERDQRDRV